MRHYSHGEVNIFETKELPKNLKKLNKKGEIILADSETTGNHHCLQLKNDCELYEKDGIFYLKNQTPIDIYCKLENRHDTITLQPSIWEIDKAQEYDYLTMEKRNVAD